ncbi:MAG: hemerythrin domain-containing protein [Gallionella sp.]|nr:hemerythrin domain-containing protein [Gallionella sp.]MDD4946008.1 hemerythrin domain-containing protein [Gallionella sp.]
MPPFLSAEIAPSFDHPLEMLRACHGKILRQCDTLQKLADHLLSHGCDTQAQQAAQGILRYFDTAGKLHHQDEEQDLFPSLRASAGSEKQRVDELLARLLSEHVEMLAAWDDLQPVLALLADGQLAKLRKDTMERFVVSHTRHVALENTELLPLAARLLDSRRLEAMGRNMAGRRGIRD